MKMKQTLALGAVVCALTLSLVACDIHHEAEGPVETLPVNIDVADAERANVEVNLAAGQLNFKGGASKLMEGELEYNPPSMKPEIRTSKIGKAVDITIRQPERHGFGGGSHAKWDLQVNNDVLLDLAINCGAGQQRLDLGEARLRTIEVHIGAGQVDLDLRGEPKHSYEVNVSGGVGQATVQLPKNAGIRAEAKGGIGHIDVDGLQKKGDHWENDAYETAKYTVQVKVTGGIGNIKIIAD